MNARKTKAASVKLHKSNKIETESPQITIQSEEETKKHDKTEDRAAQSMEHLMATMGNMEAPYRETLDRLKEPPSPDKTHYRD